MNSLLNGYISCMSWSHLDANKICFGMETGQLGLLDVRQLLTPIAITHHTQQQQHRRLIRRCSFRPTCNGGGPNLVASVSEDCQTHVYKTNDLSLEQT